MADIDWPSAEAYCENLTLEGHSDWRSPTIDELEALYDPVSSEERKIRKPFRLTGPWVWSATKEGSDSAWYFSFDFGIRDRDHLGYSYDSRALCVRRSGD